VARDAASARIRTAAEPVLVEGENITGFGQCWGTELRGRVPLLFRARRPYLMALTDRRVLIFERKRRPAPRDLVLGKRYETFALERVRRRRPLLQVLVNATNGTRMAFEFRPGQRDVGGELIARLTPKHASEPGAAPGADAPKAPAPEPESKSESKSESDPKGDDSLTSAFWAQ